MSEKTETDNIRMSQVLAGALAAVTAALLGSTMGVAGTIVGAGLASIVSTVGGALYLRSIQRTRDGVRTVRAKVVGRSGGATVLVSPADPDDPADAPGDEVEASTQAPQATRRLPWPAVLAGSVLAFVLGMMAITGVEWIRGESLSGGAGTTFGRIVERDHADPTPDRREPTSTEPSTPPASSTTGPSSSTSSTPPTTTTTTPPSDSSTPPTTTTTTTTTGEQTEPPGGTIPPGN